MEWIQYESKSILVVMYFMINRYKNLSIFKKGGIICLKIKMFIDGELKFFINDRMLFYVIKVVKIKQFFQIFVLKW